MISHTIAYLGLAIAGVAGILALKDAYQTLYPHLRKAIYGWIHK
jgi:hypothetical protein